MATSNFASILETLFQTSDGQSVLNIVGLDLYLVKNSSLIHISNLFKTLFVDFSFLFSLSSELALAISETISQIRPSINLSKVLRSIVKSNTECHALLRDPDVFRSFVEIAFDQSQSLLVRFQIFEVIKEIIQNETTEEIEMIIDGYFDKFDSNEHPLIIANQITLFGFFTPELFNTLFSEDQNAFICRSVLNELKRMLADGRDEEFVQLILQENSLEKAKQAATSDMSNPFCIEFLILCEPYFLTFETFPEGWDQFIESDFLQRKFTLEGKYPDGEAPMYHKMNRLKSDF